MGTVSLPLVLFSASLGAAWLVPGHYQPWTSFQQEAVAALAALLLCWAIWRAGAPVRWPRIALVVMLVALVPWLQYAFGLVRFVSDAALTSTYLVSAALVCTAAFSLAHSHLRNQLLASLMFALLGAAILSAGIATNQWLGHPGLGEWAEEMPPWGRPFANLNQPNHLASLIALGAAATIWCFETRRVGEVTAAVTMLWFGWAMAITQSRTSWLVVLMLAGGCLLLRTHAALRLRPLAAILGLLLFFALVMLLPQLGSPGEHDLGPASLRTEAGTRPVQWQLLAEAALSRPWFGFGWNQVSAAHFEFAALHPATGEMLQHSHSLLLDLVIYNGLPLGGLLFLGLVSWFRNQLVSCRDGATWALLAGLLALLIHAMLEFPLHYLYFLVPAAVMAGVVNSQPQLCGQQIGASRMRVVSRAPFAVVSVALAAAMSWVGIEYMKTEEAFRRLRLAGNRVMYSMADLRPIDSSMLDSLKAYHNTALGGDTQGFSSNDIAHLGDVATRHPYMPAVLRYAKALAMGGRPHPASQALAYVCAAHAPHTQAIARENWRVFQERHPQVSSVDPPACFR